MPTSSNFNISTLSADYPLLASIGVDEPGHILVWRDLAASEPWPFGPPIKGLPVTHCVPPQNIKRVTTTYWETLATGIPDYFETTSWMYGGHTMALARLLVPVVAEAGRELIAVFQDIDPMQS